MSVFELFESEVRSYCRAFPAVFRRACGSFLFAEDGRRYIDFMSGAGALNYGHNNPKLKRALIDYLEDDGVAHSLDLATVAKQRFIERFVETILRPRNLDYKLQFTGPTGANGVEAALKLARSVKQRRNIVAFSGAYHGLSSGALAVTANSHYRNEAWVNRTDVSFLPYDNFVEGVDSLPYIRKFIADPSSGVDKPAAVILETVQAEGGVNVASVEWLRSVERLCRENDILLIVDDIQVGNGRTGPYFSFERAGIQPDIVVLSKSISGFGLPMTLVLLNRELDQWKPGEHTGTFRGNNLAFVAAAEALDYWQTDALTQSVLHKGRLVQRRLREIAAANPDLNAQPRGLGLIQGLALQDPSKAAQIAEAAFHSGLIIERVGSQDNVLKILPPLTIEDTVLEEGLEILAQSCVTKKQTVTAG